MRVHHPCTCPSLSSSLDFVDFSGYAIIRFGPESPPGRQLAAQAHTTREVVSGAFSNFYKSQLARAQAWATDPDVHVAEWGRARVKEFQHQVEAELAREEY